MKTSRDPRHQKRDKIVKKLFSWSFKPEKTDRRQLIAPILTKIKLIDGIIAQSAPQWPIAQINKIDLAILRLAVWELMIIKKEPPKVIIDEAIELGKTYGSESSPGFINGALGAILKQGSES